MRKNIAIGVDIGGSHISCAACNLDEKKYLSETFAESDLNNHGSAEEIIEVWSRTIGQTIIAAGIENIAGIGFAMPGPFNYSEGIALFTGENGKYENIHGLHVPKALRKALDLPENLPVRFINDATAFALGEDWLGKTNGTARSLAITLGTGFGSAFLADSLPVVSGSEVPETGAVWHLPFESGNADDYFSTRGFLNRFHEKTGNKLQGVKELAQRVDNDPVAQALFNDFGEKLGIFLHPWMERFGVEALVMGGNISHAFSLFEKPMRTYLSGQGSKVKIEVSELKETASIIGSAVLADDRFYNRVKSLLADM